MQDAFNLGWKISSVLQGRCRPELLRTYSCERHAIAEELIAFDTSWSKIMASPPRDPNRPELGGVDPSELQAYFVESGRYTAGVATRYGTTTFLTGSATYQALARGFPIGMRFHSAQVVRAADAKLVHLGHVARADGRWRLYAFAAADEGELQGLCEFLELDPRSPVLRYTQPGCDIDAMFDVRAIFQHDHRELELASLPSILLPTKGRFGLRDYEKVFTPAIERNVFDIRGIDRMRGALVIVRPDQFVSHILPLGAHDELADFFAGFMVAQDGRRAVTLAA